MIIATLPRLVKRSLDVALFSPTPWRHISYMQRQTYPSEIPAGATVPS